MDYYKTKTKERIFFNFFDLYINSLVKLQKFGLARSALESNLELFFPDTKLTEIDNVKFIYDNEFYDPMWDRIMKKFKKSKMGQRTLDAFQDFERRMKFCQWYGLILIHIIKDANFGSVWLYQCFKMCIKIKYFFWEIPAIEIWYMERQLKLKDDFMDDVEHRAISSLMALQSYSRFYNFAFYSFFSNKLF